jgi:phosphoglycerate dehydrogenase-like enzyme
VVEGDVVAALRSGRLSLAVLDVLRREPLPDGDPLWEVDGLIVTSHTAAWSRPADVARVFLDNLRRFREAEPLEGVIDLERGY